MSIAIAQLGGTDPGLDIAVAAGNGLQILLGKGDGTFAAPAIYPGTTGSELVVGDFTEDGRQDVALTRGSGAGTGSIDVLPGDSVGDAWHADHDPDRQDRRLAGRDRRRRRRAARHRRCRTGDVQPLGHALLRNGEGTFESR